MGAGTKRHRRGAPRGAGGAEAAPDARAGAAAEAPAHVGPTGAAAPSSERAWYLVFAAWVIAAAATLSALFASEAMKLPPCVLCWYQRIFMFPLTILLPLGLFPFDRRIVRYALALVAFGTPVALYHVLLVHGVIPEGLRPCTQGVPCSEVPFAWLGFVDLPFLSLAAFVVIGALLVGARPRTSS